MREAKAIQLKKHRNVRIYAQSQWIGSCISTNTTEHHPHHPADRTGLKSQKNIYLLLQIHGLP
jgi:hypothetical protein